MDICARGSVGHWDCPGNGQLPKYPGRVNESGQEFAKRIIALFVVFIKSTEVNSVLFFLIKRPNTEASHASLVSGRSVQ